MSESRTAAFHRVTFDMGWPPGHVACYLLDVESPVLFDAGPPDGIGSGPREIETLRDGVAAAGREVADIEHLVLTHPHVDHIGQVTAVLEEANPTVYAPAGVRERFARDSSAMADRVRANAERAGIAGDTLETAVEKAVDSLERNRDLLPTERVDEWVVPGALEVGPVDTRAIHTPGHQADHLAYLLDHDDERLLVSGDMGIDPFRAVLLHDGLDDDYVDAFAAYETALDRLAECDPDRVYGGHGPVHDSLDSVVKRDRNSLYRQLSRVESLVADGHRTASAVATALSGDRDVHYVFPETMSALAHLEREGRITSAVRDGVRRYA